MFNFTSLEDLRQSDAFNFRQTETAPDDSPQMTEESSETTMTTRSAVTGSSNVVTTQDDVEIDLNLEVEGSASGTVGGNGTNEASTRTAEVSAESASVRMVSGSTTTEVDTTIGGDTEVTITETDTDTVDGVSIETVGVETATIGANNPNASAPADLEALFASFGRSVPSRTAPDGDDSGSFFNTSSGSTVSSVTSSVDVSSDMNGVDIVIDMAVFGNASGISRGAGSNADTMVERMEALGLDDFASDLGFAWSDVFG